jgi:dihydrofolate reductase
MTISAILAMSKNRVIGKDNQIPWHLSADLKYFKRTTLNHHIIMGRKTFLSIGNPLPKRTNVVLTRNPFFIASNVLVATSIEEGLQLARDNGEEETFIIGGGEIYRQSMPYLDKIYLTLIEAVSKDLRPFSPANFISLMDVF